MRYVANFILIVMLLSLCSCWTPVVPPAALGFMNVEAPVDITYNLTEIGSKRGEASSIGILGLLTFGDCSVKAAVKDGNLKRVDHIGYQFTHVVCMVTIYKTIVYGE